MCPSMDGRIKKLWCINTKDYYSSIKKKDILPFLITWVDLKGMMLGEMSQRKTNPVFIYIRDLKTQKHKKKTTKKYICVDK